LSGTCGWELRPGLGFRHVPNTPMGRGSRLRPEHQIEPRDRGSDR